MKNEYNILKRCCKETLLQNLRQILFISCFCITGISAEAFSSSISMQEKLAFGHLDEFVSIEIKNPVSIVIVKEEKAIVQETVSGTVSEEAGNPIPGVAVMVKASRQGTVTDVEGRYSIEVPNENDTLIFSFVGYVTREIPVNGRSVIDVTLMEDVRSLDEVVVVGYGTQKKSDLTGSVVSVKDEVIKNRPIVNLNQALVGQLAGVNVALNDGTPGGETSIKIRGIGSINAGNEPLYVIDGFPTTQAFANALLPSDVESVNVLKDASATAIYGSRGANGVIIITTKSGKSGKPVISVNASYGLANVMKRDYYDLLSGPEYIEYARELRNNQWVRAGVGNSPADPNDVRPPQFQIPDEFLEWNGIDTNWQDAIFETARVQNYDLSFRGGTEKSRYFFSTGFAGDDGVLIGTGFQKYSARMKIDAELVENILEGGMNLAPSYTNQRVAKYSGTNIYESVIASALAMPPIIPVYNEDGSYADRMHPIAGFLPIPNPVQLANEIKNYNNAFSTLFNSYLQLKVLKDLRLRTNFGATIISSRNDFYHPSTAPYFWAPIPVNPSGSSSTSNTYNWLSETTLNYEKVFQRNHSINLLAGFSAQKEHNHSNFVRATNFPNDLVPTLNAGEVNGGNSFVSEWSLLSYIGRVNYSFKDRYLLTSTIRRDGSSRFGKNTKWGFFPSAAVGWIISNEPFLDNSELLSFLKLRSSYGITGNNAIGNYAHIGLLGITNQTFGPGQGSNHPGIYPTTLSNPDLTWEKSKQLDVGMDIGLFGNRINLDLDYYYNRTTDLLLNVNLPTTTGFPSVLRNVGEVENTGYEIMLNGVVHDNGKLKWNTTLNFSHNRNKVLRLGPTGDPIYGFAGTRITAVGGPIGANRGLVQIGVLTQADIEAGVPIFPGQTAGDVKYLDTNGDGTISNFNGPDGVFIGDANPNYLFGMNNMFQYGNFDLNIMVNGQTGGMTMDLTSQGLWDPDGSNVMRKQWEGRYISDEEPGDGMTPRSGMVGGGRPDTRLVQKTDYLRIRNVSLGYNFTSDYLSNLRVYASVENLITWTSFEGFNPQATSWGGAQNATINGLTGGGSYPLPRIMLLGINLSF